MFDIVTNASCRCVIQTTELSGRPKPSKCDSSLPNAPSLSNNRVLLFVNVFQKRFTIPLADGLYQSQNLQSLFTFGDVDRVFCRKKRVTQLYQFC